MNSECWIYSGTWNGWFWFVHRFCANCSRISNDIVLFKGGGFYNSTMVCQKRVVSSPQNCFIQIFYDFFSHHCSTLLCETNHPLYAWNPKPNYWKHKAVFAKNFDYFSLFNQQSGHWCTLYVYIKYDLESDGNWTKAMQSTAKTRL